NFSGNPTETLEEEWLGNNWVKLSKRLFSYNSDSLPVEDLLMHWDGSDWQSERRTLYEYDENKKRISQTDQVWDETWENTRRKLYAYDEQGRNTEIIHQGWNKDQWFMRYKIAYAYDFQDRIIELWSYDWMYNTWILKVDEITTYEIATGIRSIANDAAGMNYQLLQNFPNPFNGITTIAFTLPRSSQVTLEIYDITGRLVSNPIKNERLSAGTHSVRWDGKDQFGNTVGSGIYFCSFKAGTFRDIKHILFLK
ncbi:MAG: T9SS type A sorting domain-containing protein, partial [Actinobacteria bacterium]|nr:T9SS type A sorting domain-containing protein [Actinomycetota bacterium]